MESNAHRSSTLSRQIALAVCLAGGTLCASATAAENWWDPAWQYRVPFVVMSQDHARTSYPIVVTPNYQSMLPAGETFDANSVRVIETDAAGAFARECVSHYDATAGTTAWIMSGATEADGFRNFEVYFDSLENGPKPPSASGPLRFLHGNRKAVAISGWGVQGGYGLWQLMDCAVEDGVVSSYDRKGGVDPGRIGFQNLADSDYGIVVWDDCSSFDATYDEALFRDFLEQGGKLIIGDNGVKWCYRGYYGGEPWPRPDGCALEQHPLLREVFPVYSQVHMPRNAQQSRFGWGTHFGFPTTFVPDAPYPSSSTPLAPGQYVPGLMPEDGPLVPDLTNWDWTLTTYFYWYANHTNIWSVLYSGAEPWLIDENGHTRSVAEGFNVISGAPFHGQIRYFPYKRNYIKYLVNAMDFHGMADPPVIQVGEVELQRIEAMVDLDPDTLNVRSNGRWITAYVGLPDGYNVADVDISSVRLETSLPAARGDVQGDVLMVKFDRQALIDHLNGVTGPIALEVTGQADGASFSGADTIFVMATGKNGPKGKGK